MKTILLAASTAALLTGVAVAGPVFVAPSTVTAAQARQAAPTGVETRTARVVDALGTVERQASGESAKTWHTVSVGDLLPEQTTLRTGSNGATLLQLPHNHLMRVGAGTTVLLRQLNDANQFSFKVLSGQVWSLVRKANHPAKYEVETPSAVAGVTGTIFSVAADAQTGETLVSTDEGSVQVREDGNHAAVTGGNYLRVERRGLGGGRHHHEKMPSASIAIYPPLRPLAQTDTMRQMWGLLRREGILDRRRDTGNAFSPTGSGAFPPLRLQRDLDRRLFRSRFGMGMSGQIPGDSANPWPHRRREPSRLPGGMGAASERPRHETEARPQMIGGTGTP